MSGGAFLFAFSLLDTGSMLFLLVYFIITLSDLECDYLNAQECCSKLNFWVIPKLAAHSILVVLLLIFGHWWLVCANIPMIGWMAYEFMSVPDGNIGVYDPCQIYNRGQLKKHMRDSVISLAWYLLSFFVYLYCMIISMLKENPLEKDNGSMFTDF